MSNNFLNFSPGAPLATFFVLLAILMGVFKLWQKKSVVTQKKRVKDMVPEDTLTTIPMQGVFNYFWFGRFFTSTLGAGLCPVCEGRSTQFFCWNRSGRVPGSRKNYRHNLDHGH